MPRTFIKLLAVLTPTVFPIVIPAQEVPQAAHSISVTEGTDLAVTVSPDRKTILMDLQNLIYSVPFSGGEAKQITSVFTEASHPEFSPDGSFVAIQSYAGGTFHIWTMHPDGSALRQITTGHGDDREPRISPDGTRIAFSSDRAFEGSYDIWTVEIATGRTTRITSSWADEFDPAWSPDGKQIAFVSGTGVAAKTVEIIDLASGRQRTIETLGKSVGRLGSPSFSPDGTKISYVRYTGAGMALDTAVLEVASTSAPDTVLWRGRNDDAFPFPATWMSASELIYTANGKILRADLASQSESSIPFTAAIGTVRPEFAHKRYDFDATTAKPVKGIFAPALSPDGKQIAFIALNQLYVMWLGGQPHAITADRFYKQGPAWSPDGKTLAYVSDAGNGIENIVLHDVSAADSTGDRRPAPSDSAQIMPAWSPDGRAIAFQDQTGATLLMDAATGKTRPLAPATFFPGRPAFSPNGRSVAIATIKPYTKRFREGTSGILLVDISTGKTRFFDPAPFESITTRTEDGPVYAPNGKEMAFVMDDLLYTMPVDADGAPSGKAVALNNETTDAPTWSGDSSHLLYLHNGELRLVSRSTGAAVPVPVPLTYTPQKPSQRLLIHAGRFWKGSGPDELTDVDVLIVDNRVASIGPHTSTPPAGVTRVIDATGYTMLPGLTEAHAHPDSDASIYYGDRMGRLWLIYGITELRGLADNAYRALQHREAYISGSAVGPRLFNTGEAVDGERVYYPMMIPTTSEAQLHRELERLRALDFDLVKLYVRLPFTWAKVGIDFGHTTMGVTSMSHYLIPAVALGEDGMSHISATSRTGYAYSRSLTGHSYSDVSKLLVESKMFTVSTNFSQAPYADYPNLATDPRQAVAPPWENKRLRLSTETAQHTDETSALKHLQDEERTVAGVLEHGGTILAGTDSPLDITATSLHLNLRAQVRFGVAPWQALETATILPARSFGVSQDLGTLEPGKLADLILVKGDPLQDITAVTDVRCVMKNGVLQSVATVMAPFAKSTLGDDVCPAR